MAEGEERRMLFDLRGRRRNVIRAVYAILALLMGASLFLVVGPFNLAEVIGTGGSGDAAKVLEEQAERIEGRLERRPNDEALLLSLTRTKIAIGNTLSEADPETGLQTLTADAEEKFEEAQDVWRRYLEQTDDPNPNAAQLVAGSFFSLAENGDTVREIEESIEDAARAQRIAAEARPNVGSLSTLAIYEYFNGNFAAGNAAARRAEARASGKAQRKQIERQMAQYRKRGKAWRKQAAKYAKLERKRGKEQLENPFGGLSGSPAGAP